MDVIIEQLKGLGYDTTELETDEYYDKEKIHDILINEIHLEKNQ